MILRALLLASTTYFGPGPWPSDPAAEISVRYERGDRDHDITVSAGGATATGERPWAWNQFVVRGGWPVTDNFTLYAELGAADLEGGQISAGGTFSFDGDASLLYGGGFDYAIPLGGFGSDVVISLAGNLKSWSSGVAGGDLETVAGEIGPRIAGRFGDRSIVYGGIAYSHQRIDLDGLSALGRITGDADAADQLGAYLGGTYDFDSNWRAHLEGMLAAEKRLDAGIGYRFGPRVRMAPRPAPSQEHPSREHPSSEPPPAEPYRSAPPPAAEPWREPRVPKPPPPAPEHPRRPAMQPTASAEHPASRSEVPVYQTRIQPAAEVRPSEAAIERGNRAVALGRYQEAVVHYRQAVAVDPRNGRARFNLATAYYLSSDFASARGAFEAAAQLLPEDAEVFLYLGFSEYRLGNLEGARRAWRRVLEIDPANNVASNNLRVIGG